MTRRRRRRFVTAKSIATSVIGGIILACIVGVAKSEEVIDRPTAQEFLHDYFNEVVKAKSRNKTWAMLTPGFRSHRNLDRKGCEAYWRTVRHVQVWPVLTTSEPNVFIIKLVFSLYNGKTSRPSKMTFALTCTAWANKDPFRKCAPDDLKIDDATFPDSLASFF